jgi:hypothetical protein
MTINNYVLLLMTIGVLNISRMSLKKYVANDTIFSRPWMVGSVSFSKDD